MTFEKAFESIKKKFENADAAGVADFALQITMSDEDCGGTFYAAVKDGVLSVEPYDYKDNDAMLDISKSDLLALIAGRKSLNKVVENGASIKGDASVIAALKSTIAAKKEVKAAEPKKAVKKTPAKAEAKKAVKKAPAKKAEATAAEPKKEVKKAPEKKAPAKKTAKKSTK